LKQFVRHFLFFILAGFVLAAGILLTAISFILNNPVSSREYLPLQKEITVNLKPGTYAIFYEFNQSEKKYGPVQIIENNKISNIRDWISVSVQDNNEPIQVQEDFSMNYTINQIRGESIYSFKVEKERPYAIVVNTPNSNDFEAVRITVMADFTKETFSLFNNIAISIISSIPFVIIGFVKIHIRRRHHQNERFSEHQTGK